MENASGSKFRSILGWIVMETLWIASAIMGTVNHNHGWLLVFNSLTWFLVASWTFMSTIKFLAACMKVPFPNPRVIPGWITGMGDLGLYLFITYYGHWFYGVLILYQMVLEQLFFTKTERKSQ
jgi:hypothetical protein